MHHPGQDPLKFATKRRVQSQKKLFSDIFIPNIQVLFTRELYLSAIFVQIENNSVIFFTF
jgi:hypothetical protein